MIIDLQKIQSEAAVVSSCVGRIQGSVSRMRDTQVITKSLAVHHSKDAAWINNSREQSTKCHYHDFRRLKAWEFSQLPNVIDRQILATPYSSQGRLSGMRFKP